MPVYNAAPFLDTCINSILHQSYAHWELIAINDHSTDQSWDKLCTYSKMDSRIKVFQNPGKGIIPALQSAFKESKGQYVTRMDADDVMATHKIEVLVNSLINAGPHHLATAQVAYFAAHPIGDGYRKYAQWLNNLIITQNHFSHIYEECVIPSPCWMIHKQDLIKCGAFEPDRYPEDYDLCFRFYQNQIRVISNKQLLHYWRDHNSRASRTQVVYANNFFPDLKMDYFFQIDHDPAKSLVLWGAGKKGKYLAKKLKSKKVNFTWVCDNPKKWGLQIYEMPLFSPEKIRGLGDIQIVVSVASPEGKKEIQDYAKENELKQGKTVFFFC